jgi:predicted dehydrogenase
LILPINTPQKPKPLDEQEPKTMKKTRYAICGLSVRGIYHFVMPLIGKNQEGGTNFNDHGELVGILDRDPRRVKAFLKEVGLEIPYYPAGATDLMIRETKPDVLLVVGPDGTHCEHIVAGLEGGCDVVVEKPMVINCEQVRRVQDAERKSGRRVRVAHNYRYSPLHKTIKRLISGGEIGRIVSVEFTYNLNTFHGSSYFYRWNRLREMSGGLSISKGCHHFDLVNWWLGDIPEEVFAFGGLNYFGPNGALRPRDAQGKTLPPAEEKRLCPIFQNHYADKADPDGNLLSTGWDKMNLAYDVQYPPEQRLYIYDDEIKVEDSYSVAVRYRSGATMAYSCNFCTPWEGYRLGINGTKGRLEVNDHSDPDPTGKTDLAAGVGLITIYPLFGGKKIIEIPPVPGGHGGADFAIQNDLFGGESQESQELELVAGSVAGAYATATGEAVWRSITCGKPMNIEKMLAGE